MGERATGLLIFHGNRLEALADILLGHVANQPLQDLSPDLWVVQGHGMKAWLEAQAAAHPQLGILAATRILQPASALWELQRQVLGPQHVPAQLPLDESALVWRIMAWLSRMPSHEPTWQALVHHLEGAPPSQRTRRQFQLAQQLADVLDAYQTHRPDWLRNWANGLAQVRLGAGQVRALPDAHRWQALLWNELVQEAKVQSGLPWVSRDQVFEAFLSALASPRLRHASALPERLILLGVSALPIEHIRALGALSRHLQVLVFALNPSQAYWGDAKRRSPWPSGDVSAPPSAQDHPLLAAWGQQARDFLHLVDEADPHTDPRVDHFVDPLGEARTPSALAHLQADILANRHPQRSSEHPLPIDGSLVFCKAHSPLREVQALHDQVLEWMTNDPQLQARDIVVMVSDLQAFEPLVRATWGAFDEADPRHVPFQIARPHPEQAAMLDCVQAGLNLMQSPFTLGDTLAWLAHPAVSNQFGLDEDDLHRLGQWLHDSAVRWGLDVDHATRHGWPQALQSHTAHTWVQGLQRLLLSHAMGTAGVASGAAPAWEGLLVLDGVGGVNADGLNGLVSCLDAMRQFEATLQAQLNPKAWGDVLTQWLSTFFKPSNESQEAVLTELQQALEQWLQACEACGFDAPLPLNVVSLHWMESVRAAQMGARLISGGVVFTTAMPLQSVPFKRVAMLGLNDGQFPRLRTKRDFDLLDMPGWGRPGDRSRHDDDRYLLLQALLSARDGFYGSWQGFQAQDGKPLPASVLVNQLLEVIEHTVGQAWPVRTLPLQAHGMAYFELTPSQAPTWSTHAREWHAARQASLRASPAAGGEEDSASTKAGPLVVPSLPSASEASPPLEWTLPALVAWLRHPIDAFAKERLGVVWHEPPEVMPDAEPYEVSALAMHQWVQAGAQHQALPAALRLSGDLSPGSLGQLQWDLMAHEAQALAQRWQSLTRAWTALDPHLAFDITLPPWTLRGRLHEAMLWQATSGMQLTLVSASRLINPKAPLLKQSHEGRTHALRPRLPQLLRAGVAHVLACASGQAIHTHLIGPDAILDWPALSQAQARAVLAQWCTLHEAAWRAPMPVVCDLAGEWLTLLHSPALEPGVAQAKADEAVLLKADPTHRSASWDLKRHALTQRFLPDVAAALHAVTQWAEPLYLPLLEPLQVTLPDGPRHVWMARPSTPEVTP